MSDRDPYVAPAPGTQPRNDFADYRSTLLRAPKRALFPLPQTLSEVTGPTFASGWTGPGLADLTAQGAAAPIGERIIVTGRISDEYGRPLRRTLVELWQANAAGRYAHDRDQHDAPLDPNFAGAGNVITDDDGNYRFLTIRPGAYPWRNTNNAWRPAHLHFSVFGDGFASRLVTQMYFPGDPLLAMDPIFHSIPDTAARERLISAYDHTVTEEEFALGFRFDIVMRGPREMPWEKPR
ncbi:MAG: protocatechuate 3,4-dioxygenase subunit beta [Candidatus Velthaea sp.]